MAEKILNTRILLKYDTLENWNASEGILRPGEVAIATVKAQSTEEAKAEQNGILKNGNLNNEGVVVPPDQVLVKVGDGVHTFAQLPYITAKAGDVYAWAKAEKLGVAAFGEDVQQLFTDINENIADLKEKVGDSSVADQINAAIEAALGELDNNDAAVEHQFVTAAVQTDGKVVVSRAALTADDIPELAQSKVTGLPEKLIELETAIGTEKTNREQDVADAEAYAKGLVDALTAEGGAVKANADAIAVLQGKVDVEKVSTAIAGAKTELEGKITEASTAAANDATDKAGKALEDAKDYVDDAIAAITDGETGSLKELAEKVNKNTAAIGEMPPAGEDGVAPTLVGLIAAAEKAADDAVKAEVARATEAEKGLDARLDEVETFFHFATEEEKNAAYDTLKEIQDYIEGDASAAAQLTAKVNQNTAAIGDVEFENGEPKKTLTEMIADAAKAADDAVKAEKERAEGKEAENAAAAAEADKKAVAAQGEIDALEKVVGTPTEGKTIVEMIAAAQTAATYDDTEVRGLIAGNTAAINTEKGRAEAKEAELLGAINGEIARAEGAEKAINDKIGAEELTGHTTLIAAINAANSGVATNAAAIEVLNGDATTEGSVAKAVADLKTELTEDIAEAANGRVKTISGDNYIKVDAADPQNVKLTFDVSNIVLVAGDSSNLDPATT